MRNSDWYRGVKAHCGSPTRQMRSGLPRKHAFSALVHLKAIREAWAAFDESESRFRRAIENAAMPIMIHSQDGTIEFVNRVWTELTGYGPEELRTIDDWTRLAFGTLAPAVHKVIQGTYALDGGIAKAEREILTRDGRKIVWEIRATTLDRQRDGQIAVITTAVDITARLAAEREAKRQECLLIQSDKIASLGLLVAGMAHEINNPNHAIRLNASLLSKIWTSARPILDVALEGEEDTLLGGIEYGELRDKIPTMLTGLLDASAHIESIIGGLRDFSRPAKDEEDEEVRIDLVVEASLRLLGAYIHAATSHFRLELDPGLPAARASFHGLEQVLINLIQNACQSLEDPTKAIVIHGSFDSVAGRLSIVVADEGRGMSPEELAQIRDPFFTTRRGEGGLGLGIPISVTIVEKFGGSLAFDSESGRGTRAIIELPAWEPGKDFSA